MKTVIGWDAISQEQWNQWCQVAGAAEEHWTSEKLILNWQKNNIVVSLEPNFEISSAIIFQSLGADINEILFLSTMKPFLRQGRMKHLMGFLISSFPASQLWLEVSEANAAAINLYKHLGFKESGRRIKYYGNQWDAINLTKVPI